MKNELGTKSSASSSYANTRLQLAQKLRASSIPDNELTGSLGLYMERMHLSRILLMNDLYRKVIDVPGSILEFGVRWGQNMALFSAFRGMYEPYNYARKVIGFDTFKGFPSVTPEDFNEQGHAKVKVGDYGVAQDWKKNLEDILSCHEELSPLPHIRKWELVEGDATRTFSEYVQKHPELIVALAYFDFDIYAPTKVCLELLLPRLTKGSVVVFDELHCSEFPGETIAVQEIIGIHNIALRRDPNNPHVSWFRWE